MCLNKRYKDKAGFTVIELMVTVVIAAIGIFAISTLLYSAYKDLSASRGIKALQEDMDLASLTIKAVMEEAEWGDGLEGDITEDRTGITIKGKNAEDEEWSKKFYQASNELILQDINTGDEYAVIKTLHKVAFYEFADYPDEDNRYPETSLNNTLVVEMSITKAGRTLNNTFLVRLRN